MRKFSYVLAAAVVLGGGVFLSIPSASASTQDLSACPASTVCFWRDANFSGSISIQPVLGNDGGTINNMVNSHFTDGSILNDQASSIQNNGPGFLEFCTDANLSGKCSQIGRAGTNSVFGQVSNLQDLNLDGVPFNDKVSSAKMF
jgi:peptidase inhibitor family I36